MKKRVLSLLVTCLILFTIPAYASSTNKLQENLKENAQTQKETKKKIDANKATVKELKAEIEKLDKDIAKVEGEIATIKNDISNTQDILEKVAAELEKAVVEKEEQKSTLDERLRVMYMYSDTSVFEILFSARDFSDLISKIDTMKTIADYDQEVFAKLEAMEKKINEKKEEIEVKKANLIQLKKQSETKMNSLNQVKVTRSSYMTVLKKNTEKLEGDLNKLESESNSIENEINRILAEKAKKDQATGGSTVVNTGRYLWPVPGHNSISSPYGYRIHPILGYKKFHSGIDIPTGRRTGVNAIAVADAEVIQSTSTSGYGNMVTLDLGRDSSGNSVTAVYAHLAKRYVGVGTRLKAGQAVGEVGTTGLSTGIHLHFEIRINGATRNPVSYVR